MSGDGYRPGGPPQYDYGRRVSYPNPTWRADQSTFGQPQRPPGPMRGNTMDSNRDPRRKRQPSRSPDGALARKQFKPEQSRDVPLGPTTNNHSRRSSFSNGNGTPKHPNGIGSSPSRRDSIQPIGNSNQDGRSPFVNSPKGQDSPMRGNSGRSTPLNKPNGASTPSNKVPAVATSPQINSNNAPATTTPDSVLALLTSFSAEVAKQASLQISRDQAKARADRLQLEYNSTRPKFEAFPAIKERKTADKDAAFKEFESKDVKFEEHKASQGKLMSKLATMISQNASSTDHVSRAEYDNLTKELDAARNLIMNMRTQFDELKVTTDAASTTSEGIYSRLDARQKATDAAFVKVNADISKVSTDMGIQKGVGKTTVNRVAKLEELHKAEREQSEAQASATSKELGDVKKTVESFNDVVKRLEKVELNVQNGVASVANAQNINLSTSTPKVDLVEMEARLREVEEYKDDNAAEGVVKIAQTLQDEILRIEGQVAQVSSTQEDYKKRWREAIKALEHTLNEMKDSVSQKVTVEGLEAFEIGFQKEVSGLKNDVKSLKAQQQQHARSASQPSAMPQPPPPQYASGPQQMPNGIIQSPQQLPNGINRPAPFQNGPHNMAQHPPSAFASVPDIYKQMQTQVDGLVIAVQHLKQRCDNIQTDDVVKSMLKQISVVYPNLSNHDAAVKSLKWEFDQEKKGRDTFTKEITQLLNEAKSLTDRASKVAKDPVTSAKPEDLINLNNTVYALSTEVKGIQTKIRKMEESSNTISTTANSADARSRELNGKLSEASEEAKSKFQRIDDQVEILMSDFAEREVRKDIQAAKSTSGK